MSTSLFSKQSCNTRHVSMLVAKRETLATDLYATARKKVIWFQLSWLLLPPCKNQVRHLFLRGIPIAFAELVSVWEKFSSVQLNETSGNQSRTNPPTLKSPQLYRTHCPIMLTQDTQAPTHKRNKEKKKAFTILLAKSLYFKVQGAGTQCGKEEKKKCEQLCLPRTKQ